jgi:hypothetical protein
MVGQHTLSLHPDFYTSKIELTGVFLGWLCAVGWQAAMATTAYATALQFQGLIALNVETYVIKGWHGTLFSIAITVFAIVWNTSLIRKLPLLEGIGLTLHVFGFFSFLVVLWVSLIHYPLSIHPQC